MKPVLLLIPGMLNDAEVWSDVRGALADRFDVRVAEIGAPPSITAVAELAWRQVDDVALDEPLVIAGFSMGGYVAIEMLARPRRAVQAAVLLSTSAQPETTDSATLRAKTIEALRADFPKAIERIIQWNTHEPDTELVERLRRMMLRVGPAAAICQIEAVMGRQDHRAALSRLSMPIHVICGGADRVVAPSQSQALVALIPSASLQVIDDAGHMLPCEQPQAVAEAIGALVC